MKKLLLVLVFAIVCVISATSQDQLYMDSVYVNKSGKINASIKEMKDGYVLYRSISKSNTTEAKMTELQFSKRYKTYYQWRVKGKRVAQSDIDILKRSGFKANHAANGFYGVGLGLVISGSLLSATGGGAVIGVPMVIGGGVCSLIGFINARVGATNSSRETMIMMSKAEKGK